MKRAVALFLLPLAVFASDIAPGMSENDLLAQKGPPEGKMSLGTKTIYRWADSQITVKDGVVDTVQLRNQVAEQAEADWRTGFNRQIDDQRRAKEQKAAAERAMWAEEMRAARERAAAAREKAAEDKSRRDAAESVRLQKEILKTQQEILHQTRVAAEKRIRALQNEVSAAERAADTAQMNGNRAAYDLWKAQARAKRNELESIR